MLLTIFIDFEKDTRIYTLSNKQGGSGGGGGGVCVCVFWGG